MKILKEGGGVTHMHIESSNYWTGQITKNESRYVGIIDMRRGNIAA